MATQPLTPDHSGDQLGLAGHITGNPLTAKQGAAEPSGVIAWILIVGALLILLGMGFGFKSVRV